MRRFKLKKRISMSFIFIIILSLYIVINIPGKSFIFNNLISIFLNDTNSYIKDSNMANSFIKNIINMDNPFNASVKKIEVPVIHYQKSNLPRVYIYNTHDTEKYLGNDVGVVTAAKTMENRLKELGINTIVEENMASKELPAYGNIYSKTYDITRKYLSNTLNMYPNLELIIDLHRDAVDRKYTYTNIDGVDYAKVMFVQGVKYNYEENLKLATKISDKLKEKYPSVSKGIMNKNYMYNQDMNKNAILIELGSNNNTWEEINNTINILCPIIKEVLDEKSN